MPESNAPNMSVALDIRAAAVQHDDHYQERLGRLHAYCAAEHLSVVAEYADAGVAGTTPLGQPVDAC